MTEPLARLFEVAPAILGRQVAAREAEQFSNYLELLIKWQKAQRLVGSSDPGWIVDNLLLDSLLFLRVLPDHVHSLLDLGSGAGLPGIPIKIVRNEVGLTLVESRRRRASFLSAAVRELGLMRAEVMNTRAEAVADQFAGRFDAVVMRCAGSVDDLLPAAARFLTAGGVAAASGPPSPGPLTLGKWVEVEGIEPGRKRWFAVFRHS